MTLPIKVSATWSRSPDTWRHEYELLNIDKILLLSEFSDTPKKIKPMKIEYFSENVSNTSNAFDGNKETVATMTTNGKIGFNFSVSPNLKSVTVEGNCRYGNELILRASMNGSDWVVLQNTNIPSSAATTSFEREFLINGNDRNFLYYRIDTNATHNYHSINMNIYISYDRQSGLIVQYPHNSTKEIKDDGMSPQELSEIDFSSDFTEKHYIQNQSRPLGSGKVFEQPLDHIIKKVKVN